MTTLDLINDINNGRIKKNLINGDSTEKELAWGTHFAKSIYDASQFFVSYLWLGGSYNFNTEDKKIIAEKLNDIVHILAKYE